MRTTPILAAIFALGLIGASAGTAQARDGCGPGFHRGYYGFCRPNLGPRRFWGPVVYRPAFYGWGYRRVSWYGPRWHRWHGGWGHRRFGWGGGWHRGWHGGWGGFRHAGWHGGWHRGGWHHRW